MSECPDYRIHNWFNATPEQEAPWVGIWGRVIARNGAVQVRWQCPACTRWSSDSLGHRRAVDEFGLVVDDLPLLADYREQAQ